MKTIQVFSKFTEWLNIEDMHKVSKAWLSELFFIKDEQLFFDELIESYTLQLLGTKHSVENKKIMDKLGKQHEETDRMIKTVKIHDSNLKTILDSVDQTKGEEDCKNEHRELILLTSNFFRVNQEIKNELFVLIKQIMKEQKQKHLSKKI